MYTVYILYVYFIHCYKHSGWMLTAVSFALYSVTCAMTIKLDVI